MNTLTLSLLSHMHSCYSSMSWLTLRSYFSSAKGEVKGF
jgi:hypothetical protein